MRRVLPPIEGLGPLVALGAVVGLLGALCRKNLKSVKTSEGSRSMDVLLEKPKRAVTSL